MVQTENISESGRTPEKLLQAVKDKESIEKIWPDVLELRDPVGFLRSLRDSGGVHELLAMNEIAQKLMNFHVDHMAEIDSAVAQLRYSRNRSAEIFDGVQAVVSQPYKPSPKTASGEIPQQERLLEKPSQGVER